MYLNPEVEPKESFDFDEASIEIGGNSGINVLVLNVHFPSPTANFPDGWTGEAEIGVKLRPEDWSGVGREAAYFFLYVNGYTDADNGITGSFRFPESIAIHLMALSVHAHTLGKWITVTKIDSTGFRRVIHAQDPKVEVQFHKSRESFAAGDQLEIRCTYNITSRIFVKKDR